MRLFEDLGGKLGVQRVSGAVHGRFFYPQAAGVALSYNPYVWNHAIDPDAGVVRLVFGMGTRAVDRSDDDYTRIIALNAPQLRPETSLDEATEYAQRRVDVLDLEAIRWKLYEQLDKLGRLTWLEAELLDWQSDIEESERGERWRRIGGLAGMSRRSLAVVRELWTWRDSEAQRRDIPARRILRDDRRTALDLYRRRIGLDLVRQAFILASARRAFAPNPSIREPIRSLRYFLPLIDEIIEHPPDPAYLVHLEHRLQDAGLQLPD